MEKLWLKNYPSSVPENLPPLDKNLVQRFEESCSEFKNQTAFISFGKKISYGELREQALHLSAYLQSQGFQKGDVIAIQLPNLLQQPVSLWASLLSGLTITNLSPLYTAREMKEPLKEVQAKGIILLSNNVSKLQSFIEETQIQSVIITQPGDLLDFPKKQIINTVFKYKNKGPTKMKNSISFLEALEKGSKKEAQIQERELEETLFIQYTGGTTGISKGACLSQKNILSNIKQCELWMLTDLQKGKEQALAALPLFHIFAFVANGLVFFLNGFSNLLIPNPRDTSSLIKNLKKYPVTIGTGVNTLFQALLKQNRFQEIDFRKWKVFVTGGMAVDPSVQKTWNSLTKSSLIEGYGLTEASPVVCCNRLDKPRDGFAGLPLPSTQVRIVDNNNQEMAVGEEGELEVFGPQVMKGYYKQEEETNKVLSKEGWLKTGDIAKINEEGFIQILDRKKDMINVSGFKVYPREVEEVLLLHDQIQEAAVVPSKDQNGLETVKAFIVSDTKDLNREELKNHCKKHLAPYKIPKQIEQTKEIKKTLIGKPLRRLLRNKED